MTPEELGKQSAFQPDSADGYLTGLTKREYMAIQFTAAVYSRSNPALSNETDYVPSDVVNKAVIIADALLAKLAQEQ
jgi:hypothetical protein